MTLLTDRENILGVRGFTSYKQMGGYPGSDNQAIIDGIIDGFPNALTQPEIDAITDFINSEIASGNWFYDHIYFMKLTDPVNALHDWFGGISLSGAGGGGSLIAGTGWDATLGGLAGSIPNTATKYTLNQGHISTGYSNIIAGGAIQGLWATRTVADDRISCLLRYDIAPDTWSFSVNDGLSGNISETVGANGVMTANRTSSTLAVLYRNGVNIGNQVAPATVISDNPMIVGARFSVTQQPLSGVVNFHSFGGYLRNVPQHSANVTTLINAI